MLLNQISDRNTLGRSRLLSSGSSASSRPSKWDTDNM